MGQFQRQPRHHDCKKNRRLRIEGETKRIKDVIHIVVEISQQNSPRNIATNIFQRNGNPSLIANAKSQSVQYQDNDIVKHKKKQRKCDWSFHTRR